MSTGNWFRTICVGTTLILLMTSSAGLARDSGMASATCGDITIEYAPISLSPPNHEMRMISIQATDNDSDSDTFSIAVANITDNQSEAPGGGCGQPTSKQGQDWSGIGNTSSGTDPGTISTSVQVRGERCAHEGDRVYDIEIQCSEEGSMPTTDLFVTVPKRHSRGRPKLSFQ